MPTYDYVCDNCQHQLEHWQSASSPKLTTCPECKQEKLVRQFGIPIIICHGDAKTLEQQAERNSKRFGRAECEERELRAQEKIEKVRGKKKVEPVTPWWRSGKFAGLKASDTPIGPEQVKKYKQELEDVGCTVKMDAIPDKPKRNKNGT